MPFQKGNKLGPGRPKNCPNKTKAEIRDVFQSIVEGELDNIPGWIARVAKTNPNKATELILKMSEYFLPKLKATEISLGENPLTGITFAFNTANKTNSDAKEQEPEKPQEEGTSKESEESTGTE